MRAEGFQRESVELGRIGRHVDGDHPGIDRHGDVANVAGRLGGRHGPDQGKEQREELFHGKLQNEKRIN